MKKEEFDSEKKHLSEVCEVLNNKINEMSEGIYSTDKSLQEFRRYMWENKGDMDVQELNSVRSTSEQEAKLLLDKQKYFQKLIRIQPSPYFASILYQGEDENIRKIYIGMTYLKKDEVDNYITDCFMIMRLGLVFLRHQKEWYRENCYKKDNIKLNIKS